MTIRVKFTPDIDDEAIEKGGKPLPIGEYVCEVFNASDEKQTRNNDPMLSFGLKVIEGEHDGATLGFDRLMFHTDGLMQRAKFVLRRLGVDVDREEFDLDAETLNGRRVIVKNQHRKKCPECGWDVEVKQATPDGTIYFCKSDRGCTWQGGDPRDRSEPTYNGYELFDGDQPVAADAQAESVKNLAF